MLPCPATRWPSSDRYRKVPLQHGAGKKLPAPAPASQPAQPSNKLSPVLAQRLHQQEEQQPAGEKEAAVLRSNSKHQVGPGQSPRKRREEKRGKERRGGERRGEERRGEERKGKEKVCCPAALFCPAKPSLLLGRAPSRVWSVHQEACLVYESSPIRHSIISSPAIATL
ncbi:hypothetical protein BDP81DRAFT_139515 [Colletotrichum phormii]|uniref:Uncharacterized protein n=1 Tax=Colletotrichum phormii TaxID=359342 RepID=A0AAJ0E8R1_9PEZI|nr:uncharacterized protein BDP81DRAFT_139515 [Colletotrichum phormii]KAK1623129.1 hypothetical protein BDP81DRAFT_139515 [Colletotrichum phormii]